MEKVLNERKQELKEEQKKEMEKMRREHENNMKKTKREMEELVSIELGLETGWRGCREAWME